MDKKNTLENKKTQLQEQEEKLEALQKRGEDLNKTEEELSLMKTEIENRKKKEPSSRKRGAGKTPGEEKIPARKKNKGPETIPDDEYANFVDNDQASFSRISEISIKIKNGEKLSPREQAIYSSKASIIEDLIKETVTEKEDEKEESKKISPEEMRRLDEICRGIEENRANKLENGPLSLRIKSGVMGGLKKWENFGQGEEGAKGYAKRFAKMAVNLALIGAISSISVQKLAELGIGTASALGGGVTSYLGRKMVAGLALGGLMEIGGSKIPDKVKKWMPEIMAGVGIAGGVALALSGGGLAVAGASVLGYLSSKFIKGRYTNEKMSARAENEKIKLLKKYENQEGTIELSRIGEFEEEYTKILKKYENQGIWGKLLDQGAKVMAGSVVSATVLEVSGFTHDLKHDQAADEAAKNHTDPKTQPASPPASEAKPGEDNIDMSKLAIVHKGEGIENAFIRQIEANHDLAKELGYTGDINDVKALHEFAGREAHVIAIKEGYVDNTGHEVRVAVADKMAYEIKTENGHVIIDEKTITGKILETHHEGDKFEEKADKYEYIKHEEVKIENLQTPQTQIPQGSDPYQGLNSSDEEYIPPTQVDPNITERTPENITDNTSPVPAPELMKNPLGVEHSQENIPQINTTPEVKMVDFKFDNPDHIVEISKNGNTVDMAFIYDADHHIIGTSVTGNYEIDSNSFIDQDKIHALNGFDQVDANKDIFQMAKDAVFLDKLPENTAEHQYLHNHVIEMQKEIVKNYGDILKQDKLETNNEAIHSPATNTINSVAPEQNATSTAPSTTEHAAETPATHEMTAMEIIKAEAIGRHNIERLFPEEDNKNDLYWDDVKNLKAPVLYNIEEPAEKYQSLLAHMKELHRATNLEPREATLITNAETIKEFITRATNEAVRLGKDSQIKL